LVDYAEVTALKLAVLEKAYEDFSVNCARADAERLREFRAFVQRGGALLARYAEYEARSLYQSVTPLQIEFQMYLQWLAATQLDAAAAAARAAGMSIGLYCDLAVGAATDSAECASEPHAFASGICIGAPPDMLNRQGQNWGLPPWNPHALAQLEFAPFRALLTANMRFAGALRIDHVMALTRLFWIPQSMTGADGGYVRYPFATLAAIVALESVRNRCMVIGEDLGAVPDGLRASLHDSGFLSYRVLVYERHWQGDGRFCLPHEYPRQALATVATHDMPTMTEYWQGGDIDRRDRLGLYPTPQQRDDERVRRRHERDGMLWLLGEIGASPADPENAGQAIESLHSAIAKSTSMLAAIQLDDIMGETEPVNIPGTYREYANWRRKLALSIEDIFNDPRWSRLTAIMREAGRSGRSSPG
jgi:(1->4)-alpha-D-glucan 1-alpha-D-glucosylmutase